VQTAYNYLQQELEELQAVTLEVCPEVEKGEAHARSSLASRPRALGGHISQRMHRSLHLGVRKALGGHVSQCMRRALHLGVRKALSMVASHYQLDFEAVSTGYIIPDGVDEETAMHRVDALAASAADVLAEDFTDFLFPDAPAAGGPQA
jgi:hypothetical protein